MNRGISRTNIADVALKMLYVHCVKADYRRVEADVGLGELIAPEVWGGIGREMGFNAVEGLEEGGHGLFIGFLCASGGLVFGILRK